MVATIGAGTSARYYLAQAEYYLGGHEPDGQWLKAGIGGGVIAVGGKVEGSIFTKLHAGEDANGNKLLSHIKKGHVGGYDMTFSMPKSGSVLWALSDDNFREKIEAAQSTAVAAAIEAIEKHAAFTRLGKNGRYHHKTRLTVATFQHGESRPEVHEDGLVYADPNLHTHTVILNFGEKGRTADGDVRHGALDGKALFKWKMAAGAVYHAELAHQFERLGLSDVETEDAKNGLFEIRGVNPKLKNWFSARRQSIEEKLDSAGMTSAESPALAAAITKASRKTKTAEARHDRFTFWQKCAAEIGFDAKNVIETCHEAGAASASQLPVREDVIAERIAAVPRWLTEHKSIFSTSDLYAAVASALVGTGAGSDRVEQEISGLIESQIIVPLDQDVRGQGIYSTSELLHIEGEVVRITQDLAKERVKAIDPQRVDSLIAEFNLNPEQADAARAAMGEALITLVEGAPGSGKTTTAKAIVKGWQAEGHRVIGTALAWRTANMLADELGIEAKAIDAWLAADERGDRFIDEKTVLVVDEAGLASSRQLHAILEAAERSSHPGKTSPRLVLLGDRNQLQSVGPSGLSIVAEALSVTKVDTILRQNETWLKEAILSFGKGEAEDALEAFTTRGHVHEADGPAAAVRAAVDAWEADRETNPQADLLLLAKSNAEVRALTGEVRQRQRAKGILKGDDIVVAAVDRSRRAVKLPLAQGDRIRFLTRARLNATEVFNGTEAVVETIRSHENGKIEMTVQGDIGPISFTTDQIADDKGRAQITHAVASTIASAQGLTCDRAFLLASPSLDRHDLYVGTSRAREKTEIYIDRNAIDKEIAAELPLSQRGSAARIDQETRRAFLARSWARAGTKPTALEVQRAARRRNRSSELAKESSDLQDHNAPGWRWPKGLTLG